MAELLMPGPDFLGLVKPFLLHGRDVSFRVHGGSMAPMIRSGDLVTLTPSSQKVPCSGDVVAFEHPRSRKLIVHRAIRISSSGLFIRGDNSPRADGVIPWEYVLGVVTAVERSGRRVRFGAGPSGKFIAFLAGFGFIYAANRLNKLSKTILPWPAVTSHAARFRSSIGRVGSRQR